MDKAVGNVGGLIRYASAADPTSKESIVNYLKVDDAHRNGIEMSLQQEADALKTALYIHAISKMKSSNSLALVVGTVVDPAQESRVDPAQGTSGGSGGVSRTLSTVSTDSFVSAHSQNVELSGAARDIEASADGSMASEAARSGRTLDDYLKWFTENRAGQLTTKIIVGAVGAATTVGTGVLTGWLVTKTKKPDGSPKYTVQCQSGCTITTP